MFSWLKKRFFRLIEIIFPPKTFENCDMIKHSVFQYPFVPQGGRAFNPKTALWLLANTMEAYNYVCGTHPKPPTCIKEENMKTLTAFTGSSKQLPTGFVSIIDCDKKAKISRHVVAIAGTSEFPEVVEDADYRLVPFKTGRRHFGKIHHGFDSFLEGTATEKDKSLYDQICMHLDRMLRKGKNEIYVTGHSLGASAAFVTAVKLMDRYKNREGVDIITYTAGQPRVGNPKFTEHVVEKMKRYPSRFIYHRIFHHEDPVQQLPGPWEPGVGEAFSHPKTFADIENYPQNSAMGHYSFSHPQKTLIGNHGINVYEEGILHHPKLVELKKARDAHHNKRKATKKKGVKRKK